MPTVDEIRGGQRRTWAGLSAGWDRWDAVIQDQMRPVTDAMIECVGLIDGARYLDMAAGTGEPGLSIAEQVPDGHVVLCDLAPEMLAVAARRARERGIANAEMQVCSVDALPFDDASFDGITVRFGYMFFPDLAEATGELARVLAPGGRLCASVWVNPDENPWTSILQEAITAVTTVTPPSPDAPHMYRCASPGQLGALFAAAGLDDVAELEVTVELVARTPEEFWDVMSEHVSLAVATLQRVEPTVRELIRTRVVEQASAFVVDGRVRVPGAARCIVATGPVRGTE